jgi:hypothetical protein
LVNLKSKFQALEIDTLLEFEREKKV